MTSQKRVPLYLSIKEIIKERIINGTYDLHTLIPTETELEKEFNVSKITIRKAIEMLESDGLVSKKSGFGTIVTSNGLYNVLTRNTSFSNILLSEGYSFHRENTIISSINLKPQDELYQYFGKSCFKLTRKYFLDGKPYIFYTHYLPSHMVLDEVHDDEHYSIYMQLYKNNQLISKFKDEFFLDYPPQKILKELKVKDGPLLGRKRTTFGKNNEVIEISYSQYNTKLHPYTLTFDV